MTIIGRRVPRFFMDSDERAALMAGAAPRTYLADAGAETSDVTPPEVVFILMCDCDLVSIYEEIVHGDIATVDVAALSATMAQSLIDDAPDKLRALADVSGPGTVDIANAQILCGYCGGWTTLSSGFPYVAP